MTQAATAPFLDDNAQNAIYKEAFTYYNANEIEKAFETLKPLISKNPNHLAALELLGLIYDAFGQYQASLNAYQSVLNQKPDLLQMHVNIGQAYLRMENYALAEKHLLLGLDKHPSANGYLGLAHTYLFTDRKEEAKEALEKSFAADPTYVQASYTALYFLEKPEDENNKFLQALKNLPLETLRPQDKVVALSGLYHGYHALKQYDTAFAYARRSAQAKRALLEYDADAHTALTDKIIAYFSKEFYAHSKIEGSASESPVFILAMPRSGTTLLEQILTGHSKVKSAGEHIFLSNQIGAFGYLQPFNGFDFPMRDGNGREFILPATLADHYIEYCKKRVPGNPDRIIDKTVSSRLWAGYLAIAFPKARFIYIERNAMDCCLSTFTTYFTGTAQPYSYDLEELGRHYYDHWRLMNHWKKVLGDRILHITYEDLVEDTEKIARKTLDFLGLEWEARCLEFHKNKGATNTASAAQVREPIYTKSVARWRKYEKHLLPLIKNLGKAAPEDAVRYMQKQEQP